MGETFNGHKKEGRSVLWRPERRFVTWAASKVPRRIETYHLTLATLPISLLVIVFSFLAKLHIQWLWAVSAMIALQWLTDCLDGEVGRMRDTGLVRWGYFMDHLLDYFFVASMMIGYMILLPDGSKWLFFFVFAMAAGYLVNSYLFMAAANRHRISYFGVGPTEVRALIIIVNGVLATVGRGYMAASLPYVIGVFFLGLVTVIVREQRKLWALDMQEKAERENGTVRA